METLRKEELNNLSTSRLLTLYRKVRRDYHNTYAYITDYGNYPEVFQDREDDSEVQRCVELDKYHDKIKAILDTRGHVERK